MSVGIQSTENAVAAYTTDGPDQCIVFMGITTLGSPNKRNYQIKLRPGVTGDLIAQIQQGAPSEKAYTAPFVRTGTHYELIMPDTVYSGQNFWFTIVVVEAGGDTKQDYNGTTSFTSTDPKAQLGGGGMDTYNYTWVPATDKGVHIFVNVIFDKLGLQTIVASDTMDGSIVGVGTIMVVGVDVKLFKEQRLTIAASGDIVKFRICWSNYSSASAFSFIVTDAVPMGTTYVPDNVTAMDCGSTDGVVMTVSYSTSAVALPPNGSFTTVPSGALPSGVRWLRWSMPMAGVQTTGCACFRVAVD
jgi:uncharacterized repeat protein (TIGR01451 family)